MEELFCDSVVSIVLAGGRGKRLGLDRPKAWAKTPRGRSLLEHAVWNALQPIHRAVIAAPAAMDLPPYTTPPSPGPSVPYEVFRVDDLPDGEGPMAGLVPGLEWAAARNAEWAFVLAVDLPAIRWRDAFQLWWRALDDRSEALAVVPKGPEGIEPLCSLLRPAAMAPIFRAAWDAGERSPRRVLEGLAPEALVTIDTADPVLWPSGPDVLRSVNTPEDLARAFPEPAA